MKQNISLQQLINELDFTIRQCKNISPILHEVGNLAIIYNFISIFLYFINNFKLIDKIN